MSEIHINKFGGSSLADAQCFVRVANIVADAKQYIIVSAVGGVTNHLQTLLDTAAQNEDVTPLLNALNEKHLKIIDELNIDDADLSKNLQDDIDALHKILNTIAITGTYSPQIQNMVLGFGEMWSAQILTALLAQKYAAVYLNAADFIFVHREQSVIQVDWDKSQQAFDDVLIKNKDFTHAVITGFIASDLNGKRTTLGRNGSDFSATIVAKLLGAHQLTIWTDVDGVYSADPRRVPKAFILDQVSYQEILELSYFGAKVLHPQAIAPAVDNHISIHIKNTFNPDALGTTISVDSEVSDYLVRGVSSIDHIALINIEGPGMVGVSGTAARLFKSLSDAHISVIMISQASSEHSICIAVLSHDLAKAKQVIEQQFYLEIQSGLMNPLRIDDDCAIIAAVGEGMVGTPGITARLGHALAQANISIKALAQGSSERNISAVINRQDINKALRVVHSGFYLSGRNVAIGLIGPGLIGKELLQQIEAAKDKLKNEYDVNLSVHGIMNSKKMFCTDKHLSLDTLLAEFESSQQKSDFQQFATHLKADDIPHTVIIDCSASEVVANQYLNFLLQGIDIITPNKKANSGPLDYYEELIELTRDGNRRYLYETTVCAGLPVIKTLQDMIQSGDEIHKIEGIVSGTLAYIFNDLSSGKPFSQIVFEAKQKGFTEPDPRDDLAGMDVARKMVVLGREIGLEVSLDDVKVHNLVPEALRDCSVDEFLQKLPDYDADIEQQLQQLVKAGEKACYVGVITADGKIDVKIGSYPVHHPFSNLKGTDNILAFHTDRYSTQPLVVQGPGAGAAVTAAGVFADLLRLISYLD